MHEACMKSPISRFLQSSAQRMDVATGGSASIFTSLQAAFARTPHAQAVNQNVVERYMKLMKRVVFSAVFHR